MNQLSFLKLPLEDFWTKISSSWCVFDVLVTVTQGAGTGVLGGTGTLEANKADMSEILEY